MPMPSPQAASLKKECISDDFNVDKSYYFYMIWRRSKVKFFRVTIPKHYFENLNTINFYGMTFNIPSDVESYLEYHYGEDWRKPRKEWDFLKDDGTIKEI